MSGQFNSFCHAIKAEWLKGRRTFLRFSPLVVSFATVIILLPIAWKVITDGKSGNTGINCLDFYFVIWLFFMMPMYSILVAILNFSTEHGQGLWKHVNVQPVSGAIQTLVKHFYGWCYLFATTIAILALAILVLVVASFFPDITVGFTDFNFWRKAFLYSILSSISGIVILTLLNVLAARVAGFSLPALVGFFGTLLPIFADANSKGAPFIPWTVGKFLLFPVIMEARTGIKPSIEFWWIVVPIAQVALLLWVNIFIQKKKPLY
ncbi:MAG: ABC transporter permease [Holophagaceae bacterium]|nr:ABC transporter permease [Holophagaceae bacterium]